MKVLMIDEDLYRVGGVERVLCVLANGFSKDGLEVSTLSEYRSREKSFFSYDQSVKMDYLIDKVNSRIVSLQKKNIFYYLIRLREKIYKRLFFKKMVLSRRDAILEADVIIFGRVYSAIDFLEVMGEDLAKKTVIVRDAIHLEYYGHETRLKMKNLFEKYVDYFVVSSDESCHAYENFFKNGSVSMVKIYNPIGIAPRARGNSVAKSIVSIGRIDDEQKGYSALLKSFRHVLAKHPDWKLEIYGGGRTSGDLRETVSDDPLLSESVAIFDAVEDVTKVLAVAGIYVSTARYEGYANSIVEAVACGVPTISFDWLMGVDEIIVDGANGTVVKLSDRKEYFNGIDNENDCIKMAKAICSLIEDRELYEKYSNGSDEIMQSRKPGRIVREWRKIINGKGTSAYV